jgi:integrase/recombinase XerD
MGIQKLLKNLGMKAGIKKTVHPHSFRHGRLTELANMGVSEMKLRLFAGWTKQSAMPETYINTSQKQMETTILRHSGVNVDDIPDMQIERVDATPKTCPRCSAHNAFDAIYCSKCSFILDTIAAMDNNDFQQAATKTIDFNDPEVKAQLMKFLTSGQ